jgi:hypothetical protein
MALKGKWRVTGHTWAHTRAQREGSFREKASEWFRPTGGGELARADRWTVTLQLGPQLVVASVFF